MEQSEPSQPENSTVATGECNYENIPGAMEQATDIKAASPESTIVNSARNGTSASIQYVQVTQPHSHSQLPSNGRHPPPVAPKPRSYKSRYKDASQSSSAPDTSVLPAKNCVPGLSLSMLATVTQMQPKAVIDRECSHGQQRVKQIPLEPGNPLQSSRMAKKQRPRTKCPSALPVLPISRPHSKCRGKFSPNGSLLVRSADMDPDEGSTCSSGTDSVNLSRCLTLQEFVDTYSTLLPVSVIAIQGKLQRKYTIHRVEQRTVLRIEDKQSGKNFNVPIGSEIKFGIVYNPRGNDREALHGYSFAAVSDILKLSQFPAVVAVTKDYSERHSGSPSVKKHEVLIVREASSRTQRLSGQRYLRVYSLLTNSTKDLPEQCAGQFSTSPSLVSMCVADIIRYVFPHPFPCRAVMYIPPDNKGAQLPCNFSKIISISGSKIEKFLVASEGRNFSGACTKIPLDGSSKISVIVPEVTYFEECNHHSSGEVVYAQLKQKASIATSECDYEILSEETSSPLAETTYSEIDTHTVPQNGKNGNKPEKKTHNLLSAFMQRTLRRRHTTKKSRNAPAPATYQDSTVALRDNSCCYMNTRAKTWPREPHGMNSTSTCTGNVGPTCHLTADTSGNYYEAIPEDASLQPAKELKTYASGSNCDLYEALPGDASMQPAKVLHTYANGSDCDPYEAIPGGASMQPAKELKTYANGSDCASGNNCDLYEAYTSGSDFNLYEAIPGGASTKELKSYASGSKYDLYEAVPGGASLQPAEELEMYNSGSDCDLYEIIPGDASMQPAKQLKTNANGSNCDLYEAVPGCAFLQPAKELKTYASGSDCDPYKAIPGGASLQPAKALKTFASGNDCDLYEPIPGCASMQSAKKFETRIPFHPHLPEPYTGNCRTIPNADECEYVSVWDFEMCNSNGDEKYFTPRSSTCTQTSSYESTQTSSTAGEKYLTPCSSVSLSSQMSFNSEPSVVNAKTTVNQHDFAAENSNIQNIQSMLQNLTNQVDASYGEFRKRLDSFEQQLGQQQKLDYEYIDTITSGQNLQKLHSMLDHLTVVTAQTEKSIALTEKSMSDYYVQFYKKLDSIEQQLEQQKGIHEPYHSDCQSKETVLEPSVCTVQDNTSTPFNQLQVLQWMTESFKGLEKQLMEQMQKLMEQQNLILKQYAEPQSPAICRTPQAACKGFQSANPEPKLKEVACILNGFCRLYELGVQLDISEAALDQIDHNHGSDIGKYRIKVISHWLKNTETPTWEVLAQALKDIGEDGLARKILAQYGAHYPSAVDSQ